MHTPQAISRYALYGEALSREDPEFVHIEDIRTRSRLHQWTIRPHAHHRMFQLVFILDGAAQVSLDRSRTRVSGPCTVTVPGSVVHGFEFTPDTVGQVVTVSELLLIDARYRRSRKILEPLLSSPRIVEFVDARDEVAAITGALAHMQDEFQRRRLGRDSMFEWLLRIALMTIRRQLDSLDPPGAPPSDRNDLFSSFSELVERHYRDHWAVRQYADALAVSLGRLNRLCQAFAGKGSKALVQDRLVLEAQRHLIYSTATVAMIAYDLGFQDPAYFSRFFRRRTGMSPGQFRRTRQTGDDRRDGRDP